MAPTISATDLGYYASSQFCLRCAWVMLHVKTLPFQRFPGIFSTIDRYNKLVVQHHFQRQNSLPQWLGDLGEIGSFIDPPHWSSFKVVDPESGVTVRGEADGIFRMADGSYTIVDYKTARYTPGQRGMFSAYEVQLNTYAYIGERLGLSPIGRLALVYMEPRTDEESAEDPRLVDAKGFSMEFEATVVDVALQPEQLVPPLLCKVREVSEIADPPAAGSPECKDCAAMTGLVAALLRGGAAPA